jgi:predicted transcriptional regulator
MNKNRKLQITIKPEVQPGLSLSSAEAKLNFTDVKSMLKMVWERFELLVFLQQHGPLNIRQLAKDFGRDYSDIHDDVKLLLGIGLVANDKAKKFFVPWDIVVIELLKET